MALVNCTECGEQISHLARNCPKCGRPWPIKHVDPPRSVLEFFNVIVIISIFGFIAYAFYSNVTVDTAIDWMRFIRGAQQLLISTLLSGAATYTLVWGPLAIFAILFRMFSDGKYNYWTIFFPKGDGGRDIVRYVIFTLVPFASFFVYIHFYDGLSSLYR